ncbi:MAG: hypothetical protein ACHQ6V_09555 [Myxococcota bacterium]
MSSPASRRLASLAIAAASVAFAASAFAQATGVQNPGFEAGAAGSVPPAWTATGSDPVVTVVTEGPTAFELYHDKGITVTPYRGAKSLRLGIPRGRVLSQPSGESLATQTFSSTSPQLLIAARFFSWETAGGDKFVLQLNDAANPSAKFTLTDAATGQPFSLPLPGAAAAVCSTTPCALTVRMGGKNPLLDSGWRTLEISGLPTDGRQLTLRLGMVTNSSKPSFVYFDEARRPPVARMTISPPSRQVEGDFAFFDCTGSSFDEGGELTCLWQVSGSTIETRSVTGPYAIFNFPESDPSLLVTLTVSDGVSSAATSSDFVAAGALDVENSAPIVSALSLEIPQGGSGDALCRYLDLGVLDAHTVSLQVAGTTLPATVVTENEQAYATGIARAHFDASALPLGDSAGSCTVRDDEGATATASFLVRVLAPSPGRAEPANDSSNTAPRLAAGWSYAFDLGTPHDVDVFEVRLPNGGALPANSEVEISLDATADYDLIVLSRAPGLTVFEGQALKTSPFLNSPFLNSPFLNSPFLNSPFLNSPFLNSPFLNSPFLNSPFLNSPFLNSPFLNSPFLNSPLAFDEVPLSQLAGAPDGSTVSASDIGLDELGSFDIANLQSESLVVKAISARLGSASERSLVRVGPDETALFVAVVSHDGGFSAAPFRLGLQVSRPFDREARLAANCVATPRVPVALATSAVEILHAPPGAPKSIGVIQRQRFQRENGLSDAQFAAWLAQIAPALDHAELAMRLVSLPSTIFDAADVSPCNVAAQNAAATQVKARIQSELAAAPSATSIVIFGDQAVIPHYAETDGTDIANERFYGGDSLVREDSPLAATIAAGLNLTDAFYTASGLSFGGRKLWLEQLAIGRLAKLPAEIASELASFAARGGRLDSATTLATGYDFFSDGTARTEQVLRRLDPDTRSLNSSTWSANDLRCEAFGTPPPGTEQVCEIPTVGAVNFHGTHFAGLSARGFNTGDYADFVDTTDLYGRLGETLTVSIGCHTGLDVPKRWSIPQAFGLRVDPGFDWAQQAGVQIRPINYGIGHTDFADRGTEGLVTEVTRRAAGGLTLGQALVEAKASYLLALRQVDVYDEDSVISLALLGLPQWRIAPPGSVMPPSPAPGAPPGSTYGPLRLTVREQGTSVTRDASIVRVTTPRGQYFTLDGSSDAPQARAVQGTLRVFSDRPAVGTRVHDVALRGGNYDLILGFDPVIATFTQDWLQSQPEPRACVDTMSPTQIGTVNSIDVAGQTTQTLLFTGTQFECTLPPVSQGVAPVTGNARVFTSATIEALHPTSAAFDGDFVPPRVTRQDVIADPNSGDVQLTLDATDASGLREVIALVYEDLDTVPGGPGRAVAFSTGNLTGSSGPFSLTLPGALHKLISLQYIDGAGNVLLKSFKGKLFEAIPVEIQTSVFSSTALTTVRVQIGAFTGLLGPVLEIDFGDGTSVFLPLTDANGNPAANVQLQPDGSAIVTVQHDYRGATGNAFTVVARVSAQGAGGTDSAVLYNCGDPLGDFENPRGDVVSCAAAAPSGSVSFDLNVAAAPAPADFKYQVSFPALGTVMYLSGADVYPPGASYSLLPTGVRLVAPASAIGWNGSSPLDFRVETIRRAGDQLADQTLTFTLTP